ncbi:MAG TPA: GPP34 family phosphoprotein [Prolixibacteraceae bacterium]|jgi:hypothetical protein|nr:GPP34 family phosphoprotein [Bacteroidales bacterium]HNQ37687.1 GPP34 family phosphoprotein [Prolixibacteraceae bacterium]HPJ79517.1 GPP34 family phosphoprotein [Prolixibacteraceae bacterium]HRV89225.1 GPP34 family phosphoprotein [Prolixibacteraceae bacterium]
MENRLHLTEMVLLLAVRPQKGGITWLAGNHLDLVLAGATFLEMEMAGAVVIREGRIEVLPERSKDPFHAGLQEKLAARGEPRKISYWLGGLRLSPSKIKASVLGALESGREIRLEERRFLVFRWKKPYLMPGHHAGQVIDQVKRGLSSFPREKEMVALLLMLDVAGLLPRVWPDRFTRRNARTKIKQIKSDLAGNPEMASIAAVIKAVERAKTQRHAASTV